MKRNRLLHTDGDSDPMGVVANLFDVAMVFAVALMVARHPFQYDGAFLERGFLTGEKSRKREYGNHHKRRRNHPPLQPLRKPGKQQQKRSQGRDCV